MIYIIVIVVAALLQLGTIYFLRERSFQNLLYLTPVVLIYQGLFLWVYSSAPKFTIIWFITMAVTSSLAFFIGHFIWEEQISWYNIIGIALIILGVVLLKLK